MSYTTLATLDVERLSEPRLMLPPDLRYSEWSALGERIGALVRFSSWALGDWLLYGDDHFGELVSQAETMTGLDYATLANARRTCRAFPPHRRHALLSFSHHVEVAALAPELADTLLDDADPDATLDVEPRLSVRELRDEVRLRQIIADEHDPARVELHRYSHDLILRARELTHTTTPSTTLSQIEHVVEQLRDYLNGAH